MTRSQKEIFLAGEGDNYFKRNKDATGKISPEIPFFAKYLKPGARVLEIGCSSGRNLQHLTEAKRCEAYGIDPSREAVEQGKKIFPHLNLSVGTADILDFKNEFFDFVFFGFCLYLVDRNSLLKTVAEADRVLKEKGFLGITDFDVKIPRKRMYKHFEGVFSYKMDYAQLFLALPQYSMADKFCYSHSSDFFVEDIQERLSSVVLFKDSEKAYSTE